MILRTLDHRIAQRKLQQEIEHAPQQVRDVVPIPMEGAIETAIRFGDRFLVDSADNGRTDRGGTIIWLHAEPSWDKVEEIWIPHIWGESAKHYDILLALCEWGRVEFPDVPVKYRITDHPLNNIATQSFVTQRQITDGVATTTFAEALTLGTRNKPATGGGRR